MESFSWGEMIGGLAFFFYGLQSIRNALQLMAGNRIKSTLGQVTDNRFMALIFGIFITLILQSSSATTVMLVSLAGTKLLNLTQAFGVILGADIGTTFVVLLLSIKKITDYALILIAAGFGLRWVAKRKKTKYIGSVILGFGLVFFGMHLMASATAPLKESAVAMQVFKYMSVHPFLNLIIAALFTSFVQASAATIGMTISLAFSGLITFEGAIPIILGANLGTCITAFLGSLGMGTDGKRVAVAHLLVKVTGVALIFPFISQIANFIDSIAINVRHIIPSLAPGTSGKIALTHLLFNVLIAIIFLPFIKLGVKIVRRIVPEPPIKKKVFGPKYLDTKVLDTPVLAFAQAKREILRTAGYAHDIFRDCLKMFESGPHVEEIIEEIETRDDKIDVLEKAIRFYLAKLSQEQLSDDQAEAQYQLVTIADNLEEIGDIISKELTSLARKKYNNRRFFSEEGWEQIRHFHKLIVENFDLTISAITAPYSELIHKVRRHQKKIYQLEQKYKQEHMSRLHEGMQETFETSSIHMDLLSNLRRINGQLTYIAKIVSETKEIPNES